MRIGTGPLDQKASLKLDGCWVGLVTAPRTWVRDGLLDSPGQVLDGVGAIALRADDLTALRTAILARGVPIAEEQGRLRNGARLLTVRDPER